MDRRRADDRKHAALADRGAEPCGELLLVELAGFEKCFHQRIVGLGDHLHQRGASFVRTILEVRRDVAAGHLARVILGERVGLHLQQIDDAFEARLRSDRQLQRHARTAEASLDAFDGGVEGGVLAVHFIQGEHQRCLELVGVVEHTLGDHLDAGNRLHHDQPQIGHVDRDLGVCNEGSVPRRVDKVEFLTFPIQVGDGGLKRYPACDLFLVEVGGRASIVDFPETIDHARSVEHGRGQAGFPCVPVPDQHDVADIGGGINLHLGLPAQRWRKPSFGGASERSTEGSLWC